MGGKVVFFVLSILHYWRHFTSKTNMGIVREEDAETYTFSDQTSSSKKYLPMLGLVVS